MKVIDVRESSEPCMEAGRVAFDLLLDRHADRALVARLSILGRTLFLAELREPFFTVDRPSSHLRGIVGRDRLRLACDSVEAEAEIELLRSAIESGGEVT